MNLVISGPIDSTLRNLLVTLTSSRRVVPLHERADRLEGAEDGLVTRTRVMQLCEAARVDHAYVEEGLRFSDFKLLAMDMDSTLITIECIDEIADFAGKKDEVAAITNAVMQDNLIDFADSLRRRVDLLAGLDVSVLTTVYNERVQLSKGAALLVEHARRLGIRTQLLSGGFTFFTERLAQHLQIDENFANVLGVLNKKLTGKVKEPIFDGQAKLARVLQAISIQKCSIHQVIVIGDGANDVPMLAAIPNSISYHAKAKVVDVARHAVRFGSLETILDYFG